jgi:hypothetical protein
MDLFSFEKVITESDNKQICLTTHRLRYYESERKNSDFTSVMVDKISSIELIGKSKNDRIGFFDIKK